MSIRLEMLQVARLAPKLLGDSSELVAGFLRSQQNENGGFNDRTGRSDLYYTVFGLEGLLALQCEFPVDKTEAYLRQFGSGEDLDFIHLCCLTRCWAALRSYGSKPEPDTAAMLSRIERFRSEDGGYNVLGGKFGTAYASFLALGAYQDCLADLPEPLRLVQALKFLETEDGAWTNERFGSASGNIKSKNGSTNTTAAAVTVLRHLCLPIHHGAGDWLLARAHPQGGFVAAPGVPMPDLLSTATTLHALAGLQRDVSQLKEPCLDFIDSLWTNAGGFHGHWGDEHIDCEYTYYGLLALGHLGL